MKKYLIEKVNVKDPVSGTTNGRNWTRWGCGVKIAGVWYNQSLFDEKIVKRLKEIEGQEIPLVLYDEEYKGNTYKKFKIPTKQDILIDRVDELEKELFSLRDRIVILEGKITPSADNSEPIPEQNDVPSDEPPFTSDDDLPF